MKNYTDISIIQDKSGSMSHLRDETIKGFNSFLDDQKKLSGKCTLSLTQFDTEFKVVHDGKDIQSIPHLTAETYVPGGYTALLDGIARTINLAGQRFEKINEPDRPEKVVVVIITDGQENSSREFNRQQVMDMIKHQTDKYNWQFIFLGANQDAIQAGAAIGISAANAISTGATGQSVNSGYRGISSNLESYRRASDPADVKHLAFSKKQRDEQKKEGAVKDALNS